MPAGKLQGHSVVSPDQASPAHVCKLCDLGCLFRVSKLAKSM